MSSEVLLQKIDGLTHGVVLRDIELKTLRLTIEKFKMEPSYLKLMRYWRASEKMDNPDSQLAQLGATLSPIHSAVEGDVAASGTNVSDPECTEPNSELEFVL